VSLTLTLFTILKHYCKFSFKASDDKPPMLSLSPVLFSVSAETILITCWQTCAFCLIEGCDFKGLCVEMPMCLYQQLMRCDCVKTQESDNLDSAPFSPSSPREKWLRRRTHVKLRVILFYYKCSIMPVCSNDNRAANLWLPIIWLTHECFITGFHTSWDICNQVTSNSQKYTHPHKYSQLQLFVCLWGWSEWKRVLL